MPLCCRYVKGPRAEIPNRRGFVLFVLMQWPKSAMEQAISAEPLCSTHKKRSSTRGVGACCPLGWLSECRAGNRTTRLDSIVDCATIDMLSEILFFNSAGAMAAFIFSPSQVARLPDQHAISPYLYHLVAKAPGRAHHVRAALIRYGEGGARD